MILIKLILHHNLKGMGLALYWGLFPCSFLMNAAHWKVGVQTIKSEIDLGTIEAMYKVMGGRI